MEDLDKLARLLANLNYSSVRYIELVCTLPDFGKTVNYLPGLPEGEEDILELTDVKDILSKSVNAHAKYDVEFRLDVWRQTPNAFRMMADVTGPDKHPTPYTHVRLIFAQGKYNVDITSVEYEDAKSPGAVWELTRPEIIKDCIRIINLTAMSKDIEWHINLPEMDSVFIREVASIFEGFGYTCGEEVVDRKTLRVLNEEEMFIARRGDNKITVVLDRRVTVMMNSTHAVFMK